MSTPSRHAHALCLASLCLLAAGFLSCGDDDYAYYGQCQRQPGLCAGGLGGLCGGNVDCGIGYCCQGPKECGGGMCTLSCRSDRECPVNMACEHEMCLFSCLSDLDCAAGQHCGHAHTVCEW